MIITVQYEEDEVYFKIPKGHEAHDDTTSNKQWQ